MIRHLKIQSKDFKAIREKFEKSDYQTGDQSFQVGDTLVFMEYNFDTNTFTGQSIEKRVTNIQKIEDRQDDHPTMSIELVN